MCLPIFERMSMMSGIEIPARFMARALAVTLPVNSPLFRSISSY